MISFTEFKNLSTDQKNEEILRCLPLLFSLNDDISSLKHNLTQALDKLTVIEAQAGVTCTKTRSVDEILDCSRRLYTRQNIHHLHSHISSQSVDHIKTNISSPSVDQINKSASNRSFIARGGGGLQLSNVSSLTTAPLPDISGVSHWINPLLPDIALHTLPSNNQPDLDDRASWPQDDQVPRTPSVEVIIKSRRCHKRVALNVGGVRHEVTWKLLDQYPNSRLGHLARVETHEEIMNLVTDYNLLENEYFFDRHPRSFNSILNFYRTGKLHINEEMCVLAFQADLEYWGIDDSILETCCRERYDRQLAIINQEMENECLEMQEDAPEQFSDNCCGKYQKCIWDLMEHPESSWAANFVSFISMMFVIVSTIGMALNTMPGLKVMDPQNEIQNNPMLETIEAVCIAWFTMEYFLRLAGAPSKCEFLQNWMNMVDVLAILPYYVELGMKMDDMNNKHPLLDNQQQFHNMTVSPFPLIDIVIEDVEEEEDNLQGVLQVFRVFKLARILKLARHSRGLQSIIFTLSQSARELGLLVLILIITGLAFSSLAYYIEQDMDSGFTDIPTAFYWVIITMTTVGYGDIYPQSGLGKFVGTFCAISGALTMSLPLPIIVSNFEKYYSKQLRDDKLKQRRARVAEERKKEEKERLQHFGLLNGSQQNDGGPSLVDMIKSERGAMLFRSPPSSVAQFSHQGGRSGGCASQSPSPSTTLL